MMNDIYLACIQTQFSKFKFILQLSGNSAMYEESLQLKDECIDVYIYMEGQLEQKKIKLKEKQLLSSKILKKKILNQFQYEQSQGNFIQLNIMQIYPSQPQHIGTPVFNDKNLKVIIEFLKLEKRDIKIKATLQQQKEKMKKKQIISQQALQNRQIHFDQNGSIIQQTDPMGVNIPQNQKYDNNKHARCQFCLKNNKDVANLKRCGGFYGPFLQEKYVHLLCALWCHQVFLDDQGYLKNVQSQIKRAIDKKCFVCKQKGAGLSCVGKTKKGNQCKRSFHFKCAIDTYCEMSWITFKMLCTNCKQIEKNLYQLKQK